MQPSTVFSLLWMLWSSITRKARKPSNLTPSSLIGSKKAVRLFDKYYAKTEDTRYYAAAILFHPSRKTEYLMYNW
ncbi:hypothetical protein B0H66DRAFT_256732 [Apodospora peruviana]|uniref:Uncharacterized protein n=1 Tax=Apodospora peruviana TaxID=516989 RepID=A0AAE0I5S9_9PEZI|nr:hypothetical protein B0H66DRAFT_256732 [Apodospora peruviana]